jgi:phytoene synthase
MMRSAARKREGADSSRLLDLIRTDRSTFSKTVQSNFFYSFLFLPSEKRDAIMNVYAFCREVDDVVDDEVAPPGSPLERLNEWRREIDACFEGRPKRSVTRRLAATLERFPMPKAYFEELISGCEMDLVRSRYDTFDELYQYCYRVASTVGLMCIEIFTYRSPDTKEYAVNLGVALQLTNILRDLKEDAARGRIYLPQEDLRRFDYAETELQNGELSSNFCMLMKFECQRAKEYFARASDSFAEEDRATLPAALTMARIYYGLLKRIERVDYDVFNHRVRLHRPVRFAIALSEWAKARASRLDSGRT